MNSLHLNIADDLVQRGWSVQPNYLPYDTGLALKERLKSLQHKGELTLAGIGREDEHQIAPDIRRDKTFWLERRDETDMQYLQMMEGLRLDLNRDLFLGLFEYEAHYALYPTGGFYKRHVDTLKGEKNRLVSTVLYLNENWQQGDGGELAIYQQENESAPAAVIHPLFGTLVTFLSEDIPHEVLPAHKPRQSIAGWFRCNASHADKVDPLR